MKAKTSMCLHLIRINTILYKMADERKNTTLFNALDEKITLLQKEKAKLQDVARAAEEEKEASIKDILKDMIGVLDSFERCTTVIKEKGLDENEEGQKVRDRFLNVEKTLRRKLNDKGISEIALKIGDMVDDNLCYTSDTEPDPSMKDGTIIGIEKKGYMYKEIVLRPAEVVIVKN